MSRSTYQIEKTVEVTSTVMTIQNFKAFGEKVEIRVAPITVICGPNSSGKSSTTQVVRLLRQTLKNTSNNELQLTGRDIDLGTLDLALHKGNRNRPFKFGWLMRLSNDEQMGFELSFSGKAKTKTTSGQAIENHTQDLLLANIVISSPGQPLISLRLTDEGTYKLDGNASVDNFIEAMHRSVDELEAHLMVEGKKTTTKTSLANEVYLEMIKEWKGLSKRKINECMKQLEIVRSPSGSTGRFLQTSGRAPEIAFDVVANNVLSRAQSLIAALNSSVSIGGLRLSPKRIFPIDDSRKIENVGNEGGEFAQILFHNSQAVKQINLWLKKLEIPYTVTTEKINSIAGRFIALSLRDRKNGHDVTLAEVGLGVSQILPILTQLAIDKHRYGPTSKKHRNGPTSTTPIRGIRLRTVEQPELHLHPRLQAALADIFIDATGSGKPLWMIETHSEALVLRLQRRIREKKLDPSDIAINYVRANDRRGSVVHQIRLDEDGDFLDDWPDGFFEEAFQERFGL